MADVNESEDDFPPVLGENAREGDVLSLLAAIDPDLLTSRLVDILTDDLTRLIDDFQKIPLRLFRAIVYRMDERDEFCKTHPEEPDKS